MTPGPWKSDSLGPQGEAFLRGNYVATGRPDLRLDKHIFELDVTRVQSGEDASAACARLDERERGSRFANPVRRGQQHR